MEIGAARDSPGELPFDQGTAAYAARQHWRQNPYQPGTWQHEEWDDGWRMGEGADSYSFDWLTDQFTAKKES